MVTYLAVRHQTCVLRNLTCSLKGPFRGRLMYQGERCPSSQTWIISRGQSVSRLPANCNLRRVPRVGMGGPDGWGKGVQHPSAPACCMSPGIPWEGGGEGGGGGGGPERPRPPPTPHPITPCFDKQKQPAMPQRAL